MAKHVIIRRLINPRFEGKTMSENKIKVNDVNEQKNEQAEVELPVLNNEKTEEHGESGCCGVCGG